MLFICLSIIRPSLSLMCRTALVFEELGEDVADVVECGSTEQRAPVVAVPSIVHQPSPLGQRMHRVVVHQGDVRVTGSCAVLRAAGTEVVLAS